jgi:hypothetical protein
MVRKRHSSKEVEAALRYAEKHGWRVVPNSGGHAWGRIYCPTNRVECRCGEFCITSIWSTPRNADNHAKMIVRVVDHCAFLQKRDR